MIKKLISLFLIFSIFFAVPAVVLAQEGDDEVKTEKVSSFELFWPMVAGRTKGDTLYPLKRLKENLRGALIFGKAQKAEYALFLGTKRVLEAEKLIENNKVDLARESLSEATGQFQRLESISSGEIDFGEKVHFLNQRIDNLIVLSNWLRQNSQELDSELDQVQQVLGASTSNI